jgi:hypothetical protein
MVIKIPGSRAFMLADGREGIASDRVGIKASPG